MHLRLPAAVGFPGVFGDLTTRITAPRRILMLGGALSLKPDYGLEAFSPCISMVSRWGALPQSCGVPPPAPWQRDVAVVWVVRQNIVDGLFQFLRIARGAWRTSPGPGSVACARNS